VDEKGDWRLYYSIFLRRAHLVTTQSQINIFEKDIIIFPINVGNLHWVCGAINFKDKRIEYYDSLASEPEEAVFEVNRLRLALAANVR
jgi:Ulp1 family protease